MKYALMIAFILLPMFGLAASQRATSSADTQLSTEYKPRSVYGNNFAGVELLGRGGLYSLNYDRALNTRLSLGAGVSYYQFNLVGVNFDIVLLPIYMNYYFGTGTHRAFITGGANFTYIRAERFDAYYLNPNTMRHDNDMVDIYSKEQGAYVDPSVGIGYEYRTRAGFTIRGTGYASYVNGQLYRWYGATLGTHF